MDHDIKIEQIKAWVQQFCEERDWDQFHGIKDLAIGAATESAELLEIFRFKTEDQIAELLKSDKEREAIADELADILFFVVRVAQKYGFDLSQSLERKMQKNREKYPVEKAKGRNTKYNRDD